MGLGLVTDLYELRMAASYLRRGMTEPATFSLFVRGLPPGRGFLVAAGLEDAIDLLEGFAFERSDLDWLRGQGFTADFVEALSRLRFTGDVWAIPEGRVIFPDEPLLEVTAPLPEAQLVETLLLNQLTYQTALVTKAVRCQLAAAGRADLVDFSLRRTHGLEAGLAAARASAIAGFAGTSNVEAARRFDLTPVGTMAHSYIEAFADERHAFEAFAEDFPEHTTLLVDTYDTLSGVQTALEVAEGSPIADRFAVRLDSGDLLELSMATRRLLDGAGHPGARIMASGGLDERSIERLLDAGAPIDAFGVGTKIGVSADAPSLDTAYKLVEYRGRPVMKLSAGKATLPGSKQVYRTSTAERDLLATRSEPAPSSGGAPLLEPVMVEGQPVPRHTGVRAARDRLALDLEHLPDELRQLDAAPPDGVAVSRPLETLTGQVRRGLEAGRGVGAP